MPWIAKCDYCGVEVETKIDPDTGKAILPLRWRSRGMGTTLSCPRDDCRIALYRGGHPQQNVEVGR